MIHDEDDSVVGQVQEDLVVRQMASPAVVSSQHKESSYGLLELTVPSGPLKLPKLTLLLFPCKLDGGRPPPLAAGCGIGDGDV